jgi:hypothetical protein
LSLTFGSFLEFTQAAKKVVLLSHKVIGM